MQVQPISSNKIQAHHTKLLAYIYLRQSDIRQVRNNTGSTAIQMAMRDYAIAYGFDPEKIITLTEDLGRSATALEGREGFRKMLVDIVAGRVGAVFCAHSSRLARSSRDNQQLVLCCEVVGVLIVDPYGVYDPRNDNDHLFMNVKGVIDEADGRRIKSMFMDCKVAKAKAGELRISLPTGFVWSNAGIGAKIILDPDERVQNAIHRVFALLDQCGSATAVTRNYNANEGLFPTRIRIGPRKGQYDWRPLDISRLTYIYHNPVYAGSYVFGRYTLQRDVFIQDVPVVKERLVEVEPEDWRVHLRNFHTGYISEEQYQLNLQKLKDNRYLPSGDTSGAVRSGAALLQGIVFCGKCNHKMLLKYPKGENYYYYYCKYYCVRFGGDLCQTISGMSTDEAITQQLLQAFAPSQLKLSLEVLKRIETQGQERIREVESNIKEARKAANDIEARYLQVDPGNKEVAGRLEEIFKEKLVEIKRLENRHAEILQRLTRKLSPAERSSILSLAQDIPAIWHSEQMTHLIRKELLRAVIKKVVLDRVGRTVEVTIHWQTGACTYCSFTLKTGGSYRRTDDAIVKIIRNMAPTHTDQDIAQHLIAEGYKPRYCEQFTRHIVQALRRSHNIPIACPANTAAIRTALPIEQRGDGRLSTIGAARVLKIHIHEIRTLCKKGQLNAIRHRPGGPWWIKLTARQIKAGLV